MSIVQADVSAEYARNLTDRIKIAVEGTWQLIVEAYQSRSWAALGYPSWDDYCTREFGTSRLRLPREERAEQVASLRESGLSLRAISAATGNDVKTIRGDLARVGKSHTSPDPKPEPPTFAPLDVTGWDPDDLADQHATDEQEVAEHEDDLAAWQARQLKTAEATAEPVKLAGEIHDKPAQRVTGLDGKTYTRPEQVKPRRRPLPDAFFDAAYDLRKNVERLARLTEDDRFPANREQVALKHENDLLRTAEALAGVLRAINNH